MARIQSNILNPLVSRWMAWVEARYTRKLNSILFLIDCAEHAPCKREIH